MKRFGALLVAGCAVGSLTLGSLAPAESAESAAPGVIAAATVQVTATVEKIDHKKRTITVKAKDGKTESFEVDKAVKNLDQVKKGDVIVATYAEALVLEVKKGGAGKPAAGAAVAAGTAKPGEKPAVAGVKEVSVSATITAIDEKAPSVTFKGPKGKEKTVKVKDPAKLKDLKVGDLVELTYTQAVALSVEKAPAKK
jgi:hypothetical protein